MNGRHLIALTASLALLAAPGTARADAEGPGTPQATAANAAFLSSAPAPAHGGGVCVIDTGVDTNTDLGRAIAGRSAFLGGADADPGDFGALGDSGETLSRHGTYVAGIIASQVDGKGTSGIWPAAKIYSARVFAGGSSSAQVYDYINAMTWCAARPEVKVVNLSLSGLGGASAAQRANLDNKIVELRGAPFYVNVLAAGGNDASLATVGYPATSSGVFGVGATDGAGTLAGFSNRGVGLDISTFGVDSCVTTSYGSNLATAQGTSYAAPVVSAVLAAMRSYDPSLTPDQAEQLLLDNADTVGGVKVLNAAKAFRANPTLASYAAGAPTTGLGASVANVCEPPPVGGGGGAAGATKEAPAPGAPAAPAQTVVVSPAPAPAPMVDVQLPTDDRFAERKPAKPTLRSVKLRRGVLTVRIAGRLRGERVVLRVDHKRYVRASGTVRVHLKQKKWRALRIQLQRPGVGVSKTLVVRSSKEF